MNRIDHINQMHHIILASASPRRKELLTQMGLKFEIEPTYGEEVITRKEPKFAVMQLATQKAEEIVDLHNEDVLVIGADTVVVKDGMILGKPSDAADAVRMLSMLQGSTHQVYTGVCLIRKSGKVQSDYRFYECTDVEFNPMSEDEIWSYVETKEPMDKAGAYGIQGRGAIYIKGIHGDYNNVVGLPIARLYHELMFVE